jgi:hypothetical protein
MVITSSTRSATPPSFAPRLSATSVATLTQPRNRLSRTDAESPARRPITTRHRPVKPLEQMCAIRRARQRSGKTVASEAGHTRRDRPASDFVPRAGLPKSPETRAAATWSRALKSGRSPDFTPVLRYPRTFSASAQRIKTCSTTGGIYTMSKSTSVTRAASMSDRRPVSQENLRAQQRRSGHPPIVQPWALKPTTSDARD